MKKNIKIITKHWGKINPLRIEEYLKEGGYKALEKFIFQMRPEEAIQEIEVSNLCGRGGAGFPTGKKLKMVAERKEKEKYFICNLDESEPGTYKDRMIVKNNPQLLLEGLIISALTVGASKAFIYLNGNYEEEKYILEKALAQAEKEKFLGEKILSSGYNLELKLFFGAGAYICGEETALINSIEGKRGEPRMRPPYPTEKGLWEKPTAVNNAETIANIPWIILEGGKKFATIGAECSPGTKLYILSGAINNPGVFEAPTGITVRQLIKEIGGGIPKGKKFWFAQIGGASGVLAIGKDLDAELTFSKNCLIPLGSGSVLVIDKSVEIYDLLFSWSDFFRRESCGKCLPCREGTFRLNEIIQRFEDGKISQRDKKALGQILWSLENTAFCPFGKFVAKPFQDALERLDIFKNV